MAQSHLLSCFHTAHCLAAKEVLPPIPDLNGWSFQGQGCLLPDLSSDLRDLLPDLVDLLAGVQHAPAVGALAVAAGAEAEPVVGPAAGVLQLSVLVLEGELVLLE